MAKQNRTAVRDTRAKEVRSESFLGEVQDALVRLDGVEGRSVLHLVLASIVSANPFEGSLKPETRLAKIEQQLFGNSYKSPETLTDDEVMIWMYRALLAKRQNLAPQSTRTKTVEGGIEDISFDAADRFHPEFSPKNDPSGEAERKRSTLAVRYQNNFSAQRQDLRWRFSNILNNGEETKTVAGVLLRIFEAAGLPVDYRHVELNLPRISEREEEEFNRESDLAEGLKSPKK